MNLFHWLRRDPPTATATPTAETPDDVAEPAEPVPVADHEALSEPSTTDDGALRVDAVAL